MNTTLNSKQRELLLLIARAGNAGCIIYGRGPTETAKALQARGLINPGWGPMGHVKVVVMGQLETRQMVFLSAKGAEVAVQEVHK